MDKAEIIKIAVEASKEYDQKQRIKNIKSRHDKRLRNTRLLLKHYNYFRCHADESIYKSSQLNAIDVLDEIDDCRSDVYIQSIKKSAIKTSVIISHIKNMLDLYEAYCIKVDPSEQRKMRVLQNFYFDGMKMCEIAINEHVVERTCFRDLDDAINKMSALIFGIDAVNEMSE
jgi:hypothetical protein